MRTLLAIATASILAFGCGAPERNTPDDIENRIREILTLPTFEHVYRDIVYVGEEAKFLGITTKDKRTLFSIDVIVQGGIDLSEGIEVEILDDRSVAVTLPPAKVLTIDADEGTIRQYFSKELGGSVSRLQYYDEIDRKKEFLVTDAVSRGLLVKAEDNARRLIGNFLHLAGFTEVSFERERPRIKEEPNELQSGDTADTSELDL